MFFFLPTSLSLLPQPTGRTPREEGRDRAAADGFAALPAADCAAPASACATLGDGVRLDWTVSSAAAANARPTLAARLTSPKGGYASFGFPETPGKMIGGKVVILRECANCSTGAALDVYALNGKKGALVNLDPAALTLAGSPSATRTPDGGLASEFTVELPPTVTDAAAVNYIAATGPLKPDGVSPAIHKWVGDGVLKSEVKQAGNKKAKAAAAEPVAPAPAPAASTPVCLSSDNTPYHACMDAGGGVRLLWNSTGGAAASAPSAGRRRMAAAAPTTLRGRLETPSGGYASFGFPETPGRMVGAKVLVLRDCAGKPDCPTGARLDPYALNGKRGSEVVVDPAALTLTPGVTAPRKHPNGALSSEFEVALPAGADPSSIPYITATGPLKPSGDVAIHTNTGDGVFDVFAADRAASSLSVNGATAGTRPRSRLGFGRDKRHALERVHGWIMAIAWGGLAPLAVGIALGARGAGGAWFGLHRALNCGTVLLSATGLILGALSFADKPKNDADIVSHVSIGSIVVGLALLQGSALFARPAPGAAGRAAWSLGHKTLGYATAVLSVVNLVLGCVCSALPAGYAVAAALVPIGIYASFLAARVIRGARGAPGVDRAERVAKLASLPSGPDGSITSAAAVSQSPLRPRH